MASNSRETQGASMVPVKLIAAGLIAISLNGLGCQWAPPPEPGPFAGDPPLSFRIRMQIAHFRNYALIKEAWASNQSLTMNLFAMISSQVGQGNMISYPTRFSSHDGWVHPRYDDAKMPAIWRATWGNSLDSPLCSNITGDFEMRYPTQSYQFIFRCRFDEFGQFFSENYSVDLDGNSIWTGGADKLLNDGILYPGQSRTSGDGRFQLVYQHDANLVLYGPNGAMWAINCWHVCSDIGPAGHVHNQDGNLVVYDAYDNVVWASNTGGWYGSALILQTDGDMVMYEPYGMALWSTGTGGWIY